jgi:large conductance mechanosensitive channel
MKQKSKKPKSTFFKDFKTFITRGNILDMSVGVIVGGAFTAIVNGLSNFILKPIINWILALILGADSLDKVYTFLKVAYKDILDEAGAVIGSEIDLANSIYIDWGSFIEAIINFLLIAITLFTIVRVITNLNKKLQEKLNEEKLEAEKRAAEEKAAQDAAAAEAAAKAQAEADVAAAKAKAEAEEVQRQYYENVRRQTELLERIAEQMNQ